MTDTELLPCDGCGQLADPTHIARRLRRLAWTTRFRPIHIQALLLGGISPRSDEDFLYAPAGSFTGESATLLKAVPLSTEGKSREAVLCEFQKLGLMLAYVLECPLEQGIAPAEAQPLIERQLSATLPRIRRSLKPKRVLLLSPDLPAFSERLREANLGCPVFPSTGTLSFSAETALVAFRAALAVTTAQAG
jgi:hypothetical protein